MGERLARCTASSSLALNPVLVPLRSPIIERYKTCSTPESVLEMQGVMMKELEAEQAENSTLRIF